MEERSYTLYGRRKGRRLRSHKAELMDTLLPRLLITPATTPLEDHALFTDKKDLWLEIGFGGGEHLAAHAMKHPDIGFIGCEPFVNGVASLLEHIEKGALQNIRIYNDDARDILDRLASHTVGRAFVMFADPWPKKRHAERRFIGPHNLPKLARIMKTGAELRLASDDPVLQAWMQEHLLASADFSPHPDTAEGMYAERPADWPRTRYEEKGLRTGRRPLYYCFVRT